MGPILATLIGGRRRSLGRVVLSNSSSCAVMEAKIDEPTKHVEKLGCLTERAYHLELDATMIRHNVKSLNKRKGR